MERDVLSRVTKWHGMFCLGCQQHEMCFRGGKFLLDVLSGVPKNGMRCFVLRCFVRLPGTNELFLNVCPLLHFFDSCQNILCLNFYKRHGQLITL